MHDKGIQIRNDLVKIKADKLKLLKGIVNIVKDIVSIGGLVSLPVSIIDTIEAIKISNDFGSIAWKLICRSLTDSLCILISEANLDISKEIIVTDYLENDLNSKLESGEYYINSDFFENPGKIDLINDLKPTLTKFLALFELKSFDIENILNRLPSYFVFSLVNEWRTNVQYYSTLKDNIITPFDEVAKNNEGWFLYSQWIKQQIDKPVFSESFSLRQVYIPLRAYYNIKAKDKNQFKSYDERNQDEQQMYVVDLETELINWINKSDQHDAIRIIRGGPGIGKSSFLKMLASKLVDEGWNVLFIPLHLFEVTDDLFDAVNDFLKYDEYIIEDPFKVERLIIIFDGLDELSMQGKILAEVANQFIQEVDKKVTRINSLKIKLQCIISGRDVVVQQNENVFRKQGQILRLLPYYIQDSLKVKYKDNDNLLLTDQRDIWWKQYGKLNGKNYEKLPDNLKNLELDEITAQPLLNYLVALSYERDKIIFSNNTNLNSIYCDLLDAVHSRKYSEGRNNPILNLQQKDFNRMLEEIALAAWHGDGRTTTVSEIEKHFFDGGLKSILDNFVKGAEKGVISLLAAFYFRQANQHTNEYQTFEFTHKSFGEYLTSKRIVNKLIQINYNYNLRLSNYDQGWDVKQCLNEWIKIFGQKEIDTDLVKFIKNEIELLSVRTPEVIIHLQDVMIKLINHTLKYGMPVEKIEPRPNFYEENRQAINSEKSLLIILGLISQFTKKVSNIEFPMKTTFGEWIGRLIGQRTDGVILILRFLNYLNLSDSYLNVRDLGNGVFINSVLKTANLRYADLRYADLRYTDLSNADLSHANLSHADLSHADLSHAILSHANLRYTDLSHANVWKANLSFADLSHANLSQASLSHAYLRYAYLKNIELNNPWEAKTEINKIIIGFINELQKAQDVFKIVLDDIMNSSNEENNIMKIIERDFPELFRKINEEGPE